MTTDQIVDIFAVILGIMVVIRLVLRIIRSRLEYKQIQRNMDQFMKDNGLNNGNKDEHRNKRS